MSAASEWVAKGFAMDEDPRHSVFCRFGITCIVASNPLGQILTSANIATAGLLALQYVTIKHATRIEIHVGARGFEPPTSWSQTTRSTKLSYAPNMQCVVYHGFCSRASGERTRLACCDWRPRQSLFLLRVQSYPKFWASRFSTADTASLRRVA